MTSRILAGPLVLLVVACGSSRHNVYNVGLPTTPGPLQLEYERAPAAAVVDSPCDSDTTGQDVTEMSIERAPCYGICSTYSLRFYADGRVEYFGQANVRMVGRRTGAISPAAFREVARRVVDVGFFDLKDAYRCMVTDNPTTYVSLVRGGRRKTIQHYAPDKSGPGRLAVVEGILDDLQTVVKWEKD